MNDQESEGNNPEKPLLIYDGDCGFCRFWVKFWQESAKGRVDFAASQQVGADFPQIKPEQFLESVWLIMPDGSFFGGAHAVFFMLSLTSNSRLYLTTYKRLPGFAQASEWAYRLVAHNRSLFSAFLNSSCSIEQTSNSLVLTAWLFLRLLGFTYLFAFWSLSTQITGLIGENGIAPARAYLQAAQAATSSLSWYLFPTVFWVSASDLSLKVVAVSGAALSFLLILGIFTAPTLLVLWFLFLSVCTVGQDFLSFQWDALLLEAGFLAIFLTPWQMAESPWKLFGKAAGKQEPSRLVIWLLRFLVFRLMLSSGAVKLLSNDAAWRNLTALTYHWYTQPLPTPAAWYIDKLPLAFQKASCLSVFFIEILLPFMIFAPRKLRIISAWAFLGFQLLIAITGNYAYFNLLSIALCLLLFDDRHLQAVLPAKFIARICAESRPQMATRPRHFLLIPTCILLMAASSAQFAATLLGDDSLPQPAISLLTVISPFRIVNSYGLFAIMTSKRKEIIVEGSNDGKTWLAYTFKYKPGDLDKAPPLVAPFQPRLDWQMWFAALGDFWNNQWFIQFAGRLLLGSHDVLGLLDKNPFPDHPPKYIRAELYEYRFTTSEERKTSGNWWKKQYIGIYLPATSLHKEVH